MQMSHKWTAEEDDRLRELWAADHTTMHIAGVFGYTKNSICARAHRLKLPKRATGAVTLGQKRAADPTPRLGKGIRFTPPNNNRRARVAPIVYVEEANPTPGVGVSIADIRPHQCRWILVMPTPDARARMCGEPVYAIGRPWCEHHHEMAYTVPQSRGVGHYRAHGRR